MKRKQLYKAKLLTTGDWVFGDLLSDGVGNLFILPKSATSFDEYEQVDRNTVCQFIGKFDRQGTKIFEGDYDQEYDVVRWCNKRIGFAMAAYDHPTKDFMLCHCYQCEGNFEISEVLDTITIKGNIHDDKKSND